MSRGYFSHCYLIQLQFLGNHAAKLICVSSHLVTSLHRLTITTTYTWQADHLDAPRRSTATVRQFICRRHLFTTLISGRRLHLTSRRFLRRSTKLGIYRSTSNRRSVQVNCYNLTLRGLLDNNSPVEFSCGLSTGASSRRSIGFTRCCCSRGKSLPSTILEDVQVLVLVLEPYYYY